MLLSRIGTGRREVAHGGSARSDGRGDPTGGYLSRVVAAPAETAAMTAAVTPPEGTFPGEQ